MIFKRMNCPGLQTLTLGASRSHIFAQLSSTYLRTSCPTHPRGILTPQSIDSSPLHWQEDQLGYLRNPLGVNTVYGVGFLLGLTGMFARFSTNISSVSYYCLPLTILSFIKASDWRSYVEKKIFLPMASITFTAPSLIKSDALTVTICPWFNLPETL